MNTVGYALKVTPTAAENGECLQDRLARLLAKVATATVFHYFAELAAIAEARFLDASVVAEQ